MAGRRGGKAGDAPDGAPIKQAGLTPRLPRRQRARQWFKRYGGSLLAAAGGAMTAGSSLFDGVYLGSGPNLVRLVGVPIEGQAVLLTVGIPLAAVTGVKIAMDKRRAEEDNVRLTNQVVASDSRYGEVVGALAAMGHGLMFTLVDALGLTSAARATLVLHDGNVLRQVGRFSRNPEFDAPGRGVYPVTQGCIGAAWQHGDDEVLGLPDPTADAAGYRRELRNRHGMTAAEVDALSMPSRSFAARRILDASHQHPRGVVVIESIDPAGVSLADLNAYVDQAGREYELSQALLILSQIRTGEDVAREAGY